MIWVFRGILFLNIMYCVIGSLTKGFPAWRMFEKVSPMNFQLTDRQGAEINIRSYLPTDAYINNVHRLAGVVAFICKNNRARGPFLLRESFSNTQKEIRSSDCETAF